MSSPSKKDDRAERGVCTSEGPGRGLHGCRRPAVAVYQRLADGKRALRCKWHDSFMGPLVATGKWERIPMEAAGAPPALAIAAERRGP